LSWRNDRLQKNTTGVSMKIYSHNFIKIKKVRDMTSLSTSTIYSLMKKKKFPQSVKMGDDGSTGAVRWVESDIVDYINIRLASRDSA